ncbi:hypothetical protein QQX98_003615 [Neonectria punicea]|uniref:Uncharacterized protein n=1 Tax=Neonectria punicea TaxID=979145 RepID=A0ABR1HDA4_9HYPO
MPSTFGKLQSPVIPQIIATALGVAKSAAKSPSCSRFVYTSSSSAVAEPNPGVVRTVTEDTFNEQVVVDAYSENLPGGIVGGHTVSASGETKAEQALWKWYRETDPSFTLNVEWFCDVKDVSRLHLGALLLPETNSERVFAYAGRYTINDILSAFRNLCPGKGFPDDVAGVKPDSTKVPNARSTELLDLLGLPGWTTLQGSLGPLTKQWSELEPAT